MNYLSIYIYMTQAPFCFRILTLWQGIQEDTVLPLKLCYRRKTTLRKDYFLKHNNPYYIFRITFIHVSSHEQRSRRLLTRLTPKITKAHRPVWGYSVPSSASAALCWAWRRRLPAHLGLSSFRPWQSKPSLPAALWRTLGEQSLLKAVFKLLQAKSLACRLNR